MLDKLSEAGRYLGQTMRLMVGMPDYSTYVEHMKTTHPEQPILSYEEFFRQRQDARYGGGNGGIGRCC